MPCITSTLRTWQARAMKIQPRHPPTMSAIPSAASVPTTPPGGVNPKARNETSSARRLRNSKSRAE